MFQEKSSIWRKGLFLTAAVGGAALLGRLPRVLTGFALKRASKRLLQDPYRENLWAMVSSLSRMGPQVALENSLRAQTGKAIKRPLGSPRKTVTFDGLIFNIAQLANRPTNPRQMVDTSVVIGPRADRPLHLGIPLIVSGMAYGLGLSKQAKIALARGASLAGTATNSGESGFAPWERRAARCYIVQYHRGVWPQDLSWCKQVDMIEIQLGQGASAGTEHFTYYKDLPPKARKRFYLAKGQPALITTAPQGIRLPEGLTDLIRRLREASEGAPVGVKLGAGNDLEADMAIAVEAGVDYIALDCAQAATVGSEPILQDAFGLPTLIALSRGAAFIEGQDLKGKVSLIIGGGLFHPEHFLKALALGADAVYLGTVCLLAIVHPQIETSLPWEPPTSLAYALGEYRHKLNIDKGAQALARFFQSSVDEMIVGARALGRASFKELSKSDLAALDHRTARFAGVDLVYGPTAAKRSSKPFSLRGGRKLSSHRPIDPLE
jgi:glutamate synthase domain-containing protein 2